VVGGLMFIVPGLAVILLLAALFLAESAPRWLSGAAAGAGAAVAAVAVHAGWDLVAPSWGRRRNAARWSAYLAAGAVATASIGPWVVAVLLGCGAVELLAQRSRDLPAGHGAGLLAAPLGAAGVSLGLLASVAWVAFKVGALSYGGGFVIIPLMQADAVGRYHWMSAGQFLTAVALGQVTPGPVVQTVSVVGYAAAGVLGGVLAAVVAFSPSFLFVLLGARHFDWLRGNRSAGLPRRVRPGGDRRDPRLCRAAHPGPQPGMAVRRPCRSGSGRARASPGGRGDPACRRRGGGSCRHARGAAARLTPTR
jgi:chromate transporter